MTDQIRIDEPGYVARYRAAERARRELEAEPGDGDETVPLYLRKYRAKGERPASNITDAETPLWQRSGLEIQRALTEDSRNKEISAPPEAELRLANDVFLVRHGATRGCGLYFFDPAGNRNELYTGGYWFDPDDEPTTWTESEMGRAIFYYRGQVDRGFMTVHS